ncbi:Integrase, catalytic core protein [Phytophthora megakarya]|uniref:Integrase, catalytic core protein n=1 Tax=Phytophthora megakarya TaxID=4795 RepID=A0A225UK52_9STRA|nr:Integrase, catalytic core protein [Phytophthora megakarya]
MLVALAAVLHLRLYGGDVNTAYLNALLRIRQYLKTIDGFPCATKGHMYGVMKALYGLRQSGREWSTELNRWFQNQGYLRLLIEPCLYYKFEHDIMVATNSEEHKCKLFEKLDEVYGIKDQGLLTEYLGIEVDQADESVTLRQSKYAREILETFGYESAHAVGNRMETNVRMVPLDANEESASSFEYRKAIGMLMYMATGRRPGLAYAVGQLSRFVAKPSAKHVGTLKRVLRYLAGTLDYGIKYRHSKGVPSIITLEGFCDSDWTNDPESRKSTTGFVFTLKRNMSACEATMEAISASNILQEVLPDRDVQLKLGIDNQAAHVLATNPTYSRRPRHIELRWHFVREQVQKGAIMLHMVQGNENPADAFTNPLDKLRLKGLLEFVGVGSGNEKQHADQRFKA